MGTKPHYSREYRVAPEDDRWHERTDSPYWNESSWLNVMIPELNINGFIWFYHRPNMKLSAGGVGLWDGNGRETYDCLYYAYDEHQPLPEGADVYDFSLANGLTVETIDPLNKYHFRFVNEGIDLDLTWTAMTEPQWMQPPPSEQDLAINPAAREWAPSHYDQFGHMQGTIQVEGKTLEVNAWSQRDRSWGPRTLTFDFPRLSWGWATIDENNAFMAFAVSRRKNQDEVLVDEIQEVVAGVYIKDGLIGHLDSGTLEFTERADDLRPLEQTIRATDEHGRSFEAVGKYQNHLAWHGYSNVLFGWWGLTSWQFEGQQVWGEAWENYTFRQTSRLFREHRRRSGLASRPV